MGDRKDSSDAFSRTLFGGIEIKDSEVIGRKLFGSIQNFSLSPKTSTPQKHYKEIEPIPLSKNTDPCQSPSHATISNASPIIQKSTAQPKKAALSRQDDIFSPDKINNAFNNLFGSN